MLFLICGDAGSPRLGIGAPAADVPTVLPRSRRRRPGAGANVAEVDLRTPADQASQSIANTRHPFQLLLIAYCS
jgi:hypothetical protein